MKKLYKFLIAAALICTSYFAKAQNDGLTFTLLPQMPYTNYINPGIRVPYNGFFGLGVSNIAYSIYNSSIKYNNLFSTTSSGEEVVDAVKLVNSLEEQGNFIQTKFSFDILNIGFRAKKMFVNIDWRTKMDMEYQYSKDFLGFFVLGNGHYLGQDNPCDFNVGIDATIYSEIGVGIQFDVNKHLTVGIHPKIIGGIANAVVKNDKTRIITDENTYALSADMNLDIRAASILKAEVNTIDDITNVFEKASIQDVFSVTENYGYGIDFGASYVFNKHFGVAAGVYDLGFIQWRESKRKYKETEGLQINDALFHNINEVADMNLDYGTMVDKIVNAVWGNDSLYKGDDYKTYLKTKIMFQGYAELAPVLRLTAIAQAYYVNGQLRPAMTLAYSGSFLNFINLTVSYTNSKYAGSSIGAGVGIHIGMLNLYAVTDNIMIATKIASPTIEMATAYPSANFRLGFILTFGKCQTAKRIFAEDEEDANKKVEELEAPKLDDLDAIYNEEIE